MKKILLPLIGIAALGASAQAAIIAYESYNYTAGDNTLTGTAVTGTGFTGTFNNQRNQVNTITARSPGLTYGSLTTAANTLSLEYKGFGTNARLLETFDATSQTALATNNNNLWMSILVKTPTAFQANKGLEVYFDRGDSFKYQGFQIDGSGNFQTFVNATYSSSTALSANTTYLFVFSLNRDSSTSYDIEGWFYSGGTIPGSAPTPGTGLAVLNTASGSGSGIQNLSIRQLYNADNTTPNPFSVDEFRLGTTFADVTPIPEPSTWALLAGSLTALMVFRRRQS